MSRPGFRILVGLVGWLAVGATGWAGVLQHRVRSGESASSISRDHYGRLDEGEFLLRYNGKSGTVLRAGEILRIPYCDVHVVRAGDTWSTIAQKYFDRPSIYPALAALNGLPVERPLKPGQEIVMPVSSLHRLARGETLNLLAQEHLGDPDLHAALQIFNDIEDPRRLSTGQEIRIPRMTLSLVQRPAPRGKPQDKRSRQRKQPPAAASPPAARGKPASGPASTPADAADGTPAREVAPPAGGTALPSGGAEASPPPPPPVRLARPLEAASQAYTRGDFEKARRILESLGPRIRSQGTRHDTMAYWRLLAYLEVAYGRTEAACAAFHALEKLEGSPDLDADVVSPKIRAVARSCDAG